MHIRLTDAQHAELDKIDEAWRVIGHHAPSGSLVLRPPASCEVVILTPKGRLV